MRDAQSALDQVLAFGAGTIDASTVSEVLGLVERDVLLELLEVVADEDAARVFDVAGRLVESGHDLRHVCRELARLVRDLMVVQVDPERTKDPDGGIEGDGERLRMVASRFSREDVLRGFEVVAKLEQDIKVAAQPRFHLEMALLRWVHLRKLVPLAMLLEGGGLPGSPAGPGPGSPGARPVAAGPPQRPAPRPAASSPLSAAPRGSAPLRPAGPPAAAASGPPSSAAASPPVSRAMLVEDVSEAALARFRDAFLAEVKRTRGQADWGMVFLPARRVDVAVGSVTFVYETQPKLLASRFEALRSGLGELATSLAGRPMAVTCTVEGGPAAVAAPAGTLGEKDRLRAAVMSEPAVQALLDVFPADIRDVEEVKE
jgi:DNA polymerase-3 subunit gamma/tau